MFMLWPYQERDLLQRFSQLHFIASHEAPGDMHAPTGAHHLVERVHVALQLRVRRAVLLGALLEHVPRLDRVRVAVVQDARRHTPVAPRAPGLLHATQSLTPLLL